MGGDRMVTEEQKRCILELLSALESQINAGEYYSYDPVDFVENVKEAERVFGIKYEFSPEAWRIEDKDVVHIHDFSFRRF
jgi:hypothetical protein